jgi:hypothetical protein
MDRVFVSSIQAGYGDVREQVRVALETLGKRPIMAEAVGASPDSSQRTLLDRVADCDLFLLVIGPRYGDPGTSGFSPTEDEFNEARRLGKPILALIQEGPRDAAQAEFVARVRGNWEQGHFAPTFTDARDVAMAVVRAFRQLEEGEQTQAQVLPAARQRALELASRDDRRGAGAGARGRFVAVPVLSRPLLDAVLLDDPSLADDLMAAARASGAVDQSLGLQRRVSAAGVELSAAAATGAAEAELVVAADGAVLVEAAVAGAGMMGGSVIDAARFESVLLAAATFALRAWERVDRGGDIRQTCVAAAIPDAGYKVFATEPVGNSYGMSMTLPQVVVAPQPPLTVRREDLASPETIRALSAAVKRVFQDAGGVHPR